MGDAVQRAAHRPGPGGAAEGERVIEIRPITPRPYQVRGVDEIRARIRAGVRRVLAQLATGGGKTTVAAMIALGAVQKGKRILFVAHRQEIVAQAFWRLVESGVPFEDAGVIMANGKIPHPVSHELVSCVRRSAPVQVASVQTLAAQRSRAVRAGIDAALPPADVVFLDEAHHAAASTWSELVGHYTARGAVVVGLSATPERSDGAGLEHLFDEMVSIASPRELIAEGFLVEPRVFTTPRGPDLSGVKITAGDYDVRDLSTVMRSSVLVGDLVEHWQRLAEGRTTVVFAVDVSHSRDIVAAFRAAGITAEHLDGATAREERAAILGRLARGDTQVVSNCAVLTEGWDLPRAKCCVLARPTKSVALYLQMAGRVLRPYGDVGALVLDHAGCALEHGLPQEDREWTLEGSKTRRARRCKGCGATLSARAKKCPACELPCGNLEAPEPTVRVCPLAECSAVLSRGARECPACGAKLPGADVVVTEGELVEVDMAARAREVAAREEARRAVNREIGRLARTLGCDFAEINKALYRRFRRRRADQSEHELRTVESFLQKDGVGAFAHLRRAPRDVATREGALDLNDALVVDAPRAPLFAPPVVVTPEPVEVESWVL